jgi:hypothetical protein
MPFTEGRNVHTLVNPGILGLLFQTLTVGPPMGTDNAEQGERMITIGERRAYLFCSKPFAMAVLTGMDGLSLSGSVIGISSIFGRSAIARVELILSRGPAIGYCRNLLAARR